MAAIIRSCFHINPKDLTEDEFFEAYGQARYYLSVANNIQWLDLD